MATQLLIKEIKMEITIIDQSIRNVSSSEALQFLNDKVKNDLAVMRSHANKYYEVYLGLHPGGDGNDPRSRAQMNYVFARHFGHLFVMPLNNGSLVLSADTNGFILQVRDANNRTKPHLEQDSGFSMYYTGTRDSDDVYVGFNDDTMVIEVYDKDCKRKVLRTQKNIEDMYNFTSYSNHVLLGLLINYFHTGRKVITFEDTP